MHAYARSGHTFSKKVCKLIYCKIIYPWLNRKLNCDKRRLCDINVIEFVNEKENKEKRFGVRQN
jgi:hypothetical protein